jgi:hypothetical protein
METENIDTLLDQFTKIERETALSEHAGSDYESPVLRKATNTSFSFRDFFTKRNLLNVSVLLFGFFVWSLAAVALLNSKSNRNEDDGFSWKKYFFNVFIIFLSLIALFVIVQWIRRKYFSPL